MRLHEYQAKQVFADAGIPTPASQLAETVDDAVAAAEEIGYPVAIKAQVHVGGRGKAGGIKLAENEDEAREYADDILGMDLKGYEVQRVLVEEAVDFVNARASCDRPFERVTHESYRPNSPASSRDRRGPTVDD
jgi:succinyl-CoA synthetase beta subunit